MAKEAKNKEKKIKDSTSKKDSKKEKRHFLKDVKAELKKVIWPTPKQLLNNTLAVIASVIIVGVIVFLLDLCFEKINTFGIEKLKTVVQSSQNATLDDTTENSTVENLDADDNDTQENVEDSAETSSEDNTGSTDNAE